MAKPTNKEIIDVVVQDMPQEFSARIDGLSGPELLAVFDDFPHTANAFITTLTNKVTKTLLYSKIYQNPLRELKKGLLAYGDSIEELFVQMAQVKGFTHSWNDEANSQTPEADLIRKLVPKVSALYITINVDYKSKTTVYDKQLRKAFLNEGGLSSLINQIVGSITSAMEYKEFQLTKATINNLVASAKTISGVGATGSIDVNTSPLDYQIVKQTPYVVKVGTDLNDGQTMSKLSQEIREATGLMQFPNRHFNLAAELTWSRPEDLILLTTPQVMASLDVNVLANAFNVSMTDIKTRTILVNEMPAGIFKAGTTALTDKTPTAIQSTGNGPVNDPAYKVCAILCDKDLVQIWDTYQGTGTFRNEHEAYTNHFANREGIFATCLFANMVVFYTKA